MPLATIELDADRDLGQSKVIAPHRVDNFWPMQIVSGF
jgi:hypothetical protein